MKYKQAKRQRRNRKVCIPPMFYTKKVHLRFCLAEILCKHVRLKIGGKNLVLTCLNCAFSLSDGIRQIQGKLTHMEIFLDFCQ